MALLYGSARSAFIGWTMGVNHSTQGAVTVAAINNLALITGNIGRAGSAPFSITGQCNAMGTRESGFTSSCPAIASSTPPQIAKSCAPLEHRQSERIPTARGLAYPDIIEAAVAGKIKALWFIATNPAVSFPNYNLLAQALAAPSSSSYRTASTRHPPATSPTWCCPPRSGAKKKGPTPTPSGAISKVNAAVQPPGEARPTSTSSSLSPRRLGVRDELFPGWPTTHDAFREWQRVSAGRLCDYSPFTWQQIEDAGGMQWGGAALYTDGIFPTHDGRAMLHSVPCVPFVEQPNDEYDFILNTGRTVEHWHTRTKTRQVDLLNSMVPNAWLEMNPADATRLSLKPHDRVTVVKPPGRSRERGAAHDRHRRTRPGLHAVSLRRGKLQPRHAGCLRPYLT